MRPWLTEKSTKLTEQKGQYVFQVKMDADKFDIKKAVEDKFGVDVVSIRTVKAMGLRADGGIQFTVSPVYTDEFFANVAREFAPLKVLVNVLCPGFFPAEQNRKILSPERTATIMSQTPMGRFGEPGAGLALSGRPA